MFGLSSSEVIFFVGIAVMAIVAVTAIICVIVFAVTGRSIKERLEQEYGKPWK